MTSPVLPRPAHRFLVGWPGSILVFIEPCLLAILTWQTLSWCLQMSDWLHQIDFATFYSGAWRLAHGLSPYGKVFVIDQTQGDFISPPWFALILAPLTYLPYKSAADVWLALNLFLLGGSVILAVRLCRFRLEAQWGLIVVLALFLWRPVVDHLLYGQNALLSNASVLAALLLFLRGHTCWAGLFMVIAASKPQLIFLVGLGLAIWEWRQRRTVNLIWSSAAVSAASLLICFLIVPGWASDGIQRQSDVHWHYWDYTINARTLLAFPFGPTAASEALYLALLVAGSGVVLLQWFRSNSSPVYLTSITLCATLLLTPYANIYDYVLLILPLFVLGTAICRLQGRSRFFLLPFLAFATYAPVMLSQWLVQLLERKTVWNWFQQTIGEAAIGSIWTDVKWNTRFIVMIIPLILIAMLVRYKDVVDREKMRLFEQNELEKQPTG